MLELYNASVTRVELVLKICVENQRKKFILEVWIVEMEIHTNMRPVGKLDSDLRQAREQELLVI